ncbi:uncharacterized protein EDB91DRAFT_1086782 [Suillus paluster]|uniref:uncharacterized protein n=1 Tax=Suillus paluster TaxID=48578 RepID=UPI001B8866F2|nr:uncharacterized protein EDB91DRAFT_1086782 [Suillus paluster]KAG1726425.1 hypothetical protein EDB91DRAFT_1086782 [Suillus paluster]
MSNQANKSMADLKEITGQLLVIVRAAQQIPPGPSHFALATQASELVARAVWDHGKSACLPGLVLSCSRELIQTRNCSPQEAPNWRSIGHDDPQLMQHSWCSKALAWQALGDHLFNLAHEVDGSATDNAPGPSTSVDGDALEKGKEKAREVEPELEKEMEKPKEEQEKPCRKQPFSWMSKPLPKSVMKTPKRGKSGQEQKLRESVDSSDKEEEEDGLSKPHSDTSSVIVTWRVSATQPSRPSGPPRSLGSPKKAPFGPVTQTPPLMRPDVPESSQATSKSPRDVPLVVDAGAILIPRPNNPCRCCTQYELPCTTRFDKRKGTALMSTLAATTRGRSTEWTRASSTGPSTSQSKVQTQSQSWGPSVVPSEPRGNPPKPWSQGQSKPTGSVMMPIPPAAIIASSSSAAPHAAQDFPILDLHWMSIAIHETAPGSQSHIHLAPLPLIDFGIDSTGEEGSTIVAPVTKPTHPPSQTEAVLDPPTAIESTVPVDAVHSPADNGASTFALAFALPAPPAMNPTPLETPKDGPSAGEIVEHGSPLNLLLEYDSGDEQDAVMEIVLSNQYSIPTIVQTSEPHACSKESQGPSPEHIGARYSVFAFWLLILGPLTLIPNVHWHLVLGTQYLVRLSVHVIGTRYSILGARFAILPDPQVPGPPSPTLGTWYSILSTHHPGRGSPFSILSTQVRRSQSFDPRYLILTPQFAIPDPRYFSWPYSVLGSEVSVLRPSVLDPQCPGSPSLILGTQYSVLGAPFAILDTHLYDGSCY